MVLRTSIQGAESGDLSGRVAQSLRWEGRGKLDAKHQASTWPAQGGKQPPGPGGMFHDEGVTFDLHAALLERLR